jgi:hypothetical protein
MVIGSWWLVLDTGCLILDQVLNDKMDDRNDMDTGTVSLQTMDSVSSTE